MKQNDKKNDKQTPSTSNNSLRREDEDAEKTVKLKKTSVTFNPEISVKYDTNGSQIAETSVTDCEDISERVLTIAQRRKRAMIMRRLKPRLKRAREVAQRRFASQQALERRARKLAKKILRKRFMGDRGASYATLSASERVMVDTALDKKITPQLIDRMMRKLLPKIRKAEIDRLRRFNSKAKQLSNKTAVVSESVENSLIAKSVDSQISFEVLRSVFVRGLNQGADGNLTEEQVAFNRVNSFIAGGKARKIDADLLNGNEDEKAGDIGTDKLVNNYRKAIPGQNVQNEQIDHRERQLKNMLDDHRHNKKVADVIATHREVNDKRRKRQLAALARIHAERNAKKNEQK